MTHTPGPWEVWPEIEGGILADRHLVYINVGPKDARRVSAVSVYGSRRDGTKSGNRNVPEDECRANARLIAAAPELISTLRWLCEQMEAEQAIGVSGFEDWLAPARAAIAKALGHD